MGEQFVGEKGDEEVKIKKGANKKKVAIISISLLLIFIAAFFISGVLFKNMNIAVAGNLTKDTGDTLFEKEEIAFQKKEYSKSIRNQAVLEIHEREIKEKAAAEVAAAEAAAKSNQGFLQDGSKVAYLTFDDGPCTSVTIRILDTLKQYNVKATFFVLGSMAENNTWIVKREKDEGHVVANHTYSHNYNYLYADTKNLIDDFKKCEVVLKSILVDYNSKLVRFPGGAMGTAREPFRQAAVNAGYHYVDWNALNSDSDAKYIPAGSSCVPVDSLINCIKETTIGKQHVVILMHDAPGKTTTADSLPQVIEYLKAQGYIFKLLD
jgi:peptidoglycan/xylan/chitin deacetylase (PgdA/CDA1 family)